MVGEDKGAETLRADVTEEELVQRLQAGDAEAFDRLFRQHFPKVYRHAVHLVGPVAEAEKVTMDDYLP